MDAVDRQVEAYNAHDLDAFVTCYSPDVVIEDGLGNRILQGHAAIRERYRPTFESSPNMHARIVNRIRIGSYVIDEEQVTGVEMPGHPPDIHGVVVYRLEGDRIVHVRFLS